jgi:hypothetical protein
MCAVLDIDPQRLFNVLAGLTVLSFLVERALAVIFEWRPFLQRTRAKLRGVKEVIAVSVSCTLCWHWNIDAMAELLALEPGRWGYLLTGGIIAGGSKASIKLFHDVLGAMSSAEAERRALPPASSGLPLSTPQAEMPRLTPPSGATLKTS